MKKMRHDSFSSIMSLFKKSPPFVSHRGTEQVQDVKQVLKKIREQQLIDEHEEAKFEEKRSDLMYRIHQADTDKEYQRLSHIYGQQIKLLAEQGIYDYPDPPKLPRYR